MGIGRRLLDYAVPVGLAATAFLNARTVSSLVGVTLAPPAFGPAVAEARPRVAHAPPRPDARPILDRNPFEHGAPTTKDESMCSVVHPIVVVGADDPAIAFAALDVGGKRVLKRRGDDVLGMRVAHVGRESVWLERDGRVCEARLFAPPRGEGGLLARAPRP